MAIEVSEEWIEDQEGRRIYTISRGGGLPVVFCNGIGVSSASFWPPICRPLAERVRTINWDYLGHGRSDPPRDPARLTITSCAEKLAFVLDQMEIDKAVIAGHSMGVQVAFEFYKMFPERVLGLIPMLGTYEHPFDNFFRFSGSALIFDQVTQQVLRYPEPVTRMWPHFFHSIVAQPFARLVGIVHPTLISKKELDVYLQHMKVLNPLAFVYLARDMQAHSAADILEEIDVPTLILAGEKDIFTPIEASYVMEEKIPNAEMLVVREGSHAALAEQPELFWLRIEKFLVSHFPEEVSADPVRKRLPHKREPEAKEPSIA